MAAVSKRGRGRKALNDVTESEVNISAGITEISEKSKDSLTAIVSPSKGKNAKSKKKTQNPTETSSPAFTDELEKLQAQLQQLKIQKSNLEEMLKEKDEILKKKEEQQEKLQAELKKLQRVKEFKPTVELSEEEKQKWTEKAAKDMVEYKKEMEEYNKSDAVRIEEMSDLDSDINDGHSKFKLIKDLYVQLDNKEFALGDCKNK